MDLQQTHPACWECRLIKAMAISLNTIFFYIFLESPRDSPEAVDW